jgi:hypothetical protein
VPALASGNQIDSGFYKRFFRSLLKEAKALLDELA